MKKMPKKTIYQSNIVDVWVALATFFILEVRVSNPNLFPQRLIFTESNVS